MSRLRERALTLVPSRSQAHEFIFNKFYHTCSWARLWFSIGCFALGAGIMALLGKWA